MQASRMAYVGAGRAPAQGGSAAPRGPATRGPAIGCAAPERVPTSRANLLYTLPTADLVLGVAEIPENQKRKKHVIYGRWAL